MKKRTILFSIILALSLGGCGQKPIQQDVKTVEEEEGVSEEPQEEPEPEEEIEDTSFTICMVGDILLHDQLEEVAAQEAESDPNVNYSYEFMFTNTKEFIESCDLAVVNQEVIIGGEDLRVKGYPNFNAPYEVADQLVEAGFDVICHGTNHALDRGKEGLINCQNYWENNYPQVEVLGIHDSAEDQNEISVVEINGVKLALLNYTYSTNGISLPADMPYGVDYLSENRVISDIQRAEELADFTVVFPHWGTEYRLTKDSNQEKWTRIFLENGVDLVIGTHPHVLEPVEMVEDENGRQMLVYYSLGNYINWTETEGAGVANKALGGIAYVTLDVNDEGKPFIKSYDLIPIVTHLENNPKSAEVLFLQDYTEDLAQVNVIKEKDPAFSLEYCENLFESIYKK